MMNKLDSKMLFLALKVIFALVFIFAGIEKIADPESFAVSIENYRIFPDISINFIAVFLPWLELIAGILLLWDKNIPENLLIMNVLMWSFTILIVIAVLRGLNIDCGCFGTSQGSKVGLLKIGENIILILVGLYLQYFSTKRTGIESGI